MKLKILALTFCAIIGLTGWGKTESKESADTGTVNMETGNTGIITTAPPEYTNKEVEEVKDEETEKIKKLLSEKYDEAMKFIITDKHTDAFGDTCYTAYYKFEENLKFEAKLKNGKLQDDYAVRYACDSMEFLFESYIDRFETNYVVIATTEDRYNEIKKENNTLDLHFTNYIDKYPESTYNIYLVFDKGKADRIGEMSRYEMLSETLDYIPANGEIHIYYTDKETIEKAIEYKNNMIVSQITDDFFTIVEDAMHISSEITDGYLDYTMDEYQELYLEQEKLWKQ